MRHQSSDYLCTLQESLTSALARSNIQLRWCSVICLSWVLTGSHVYYQYHPRAASVITLLWVVVQLLSNIEN